MGTLTVPDLHTLDGVPVDGVPPEFALYPFGVFTTFVLVDGRVLGWREHVARLAHGVAELWGHDLDRGHLAAAIHTHAALTRGGRTVRVTIYPDSLAIATPGEAQGCRILVSSGPAVFPFEQQRVFRVRSVEYERKFAEIKSTDLFTQIRLRRDAQLAGFDDALFRSGEHVREGATWTVLAWRGGEVATPNSSVLHSITADHLGAIGEAIGWHFTRRALRFEELPDSDLVMAVNANSPARAISRIDNVELAVDRDLLDDVARAYSRLPRETLGG